MNRTLIRRTVMVGLVLPFLYFGAASAMFVYTIYRQNTSGMRLQLPSASPPSSDQRILIFAPHCDDETLGAGGLIQRAVRAGARVRVVMITNGDGFRVAVEREFRALRVSPRDYVRFAAVRQDESLAALMLLGLHRDDVDFLGYPDRGLMALWTVNWSPDHPFTSAYTQVDRSPYERAFRPNAVYCGQYLLEDITSVLQEFRPTDVYVTHPSDDHADHAAASAFVTRALQALREEGASWAASCRLRYYLVHRGDWPVPQGLQERALLMPPAEMAELDTSWQAFPLSPQEEARKRQAILTYHSQVAVMKRFLVSFVRRNELFGELAPGIAPSVPEGMVRVDGDPAEWNSIAPVALDPVRDNLLRDFQAGGDVQRVYACHDARYLYLRVDTARPLSHRVEFRISIRYFGDPRLGEAGGFERIIVRSDGSATPADMPVGEADNRLEAAIRLRDLGYSRHLAVNVETLFAGLLVDRTGYRFVDL
ncbi:MAG: PIG-L deacetylase family protein [Chthonomonadales bacterium]